MAFVPATNVCKVVISGNYASQLHNNILHYQHAGPMTNANISALLSAVQTAWETNVIPLQNPSYQVTHYDGLDLTAFGNPVLQIINGTPVAGTASGNQLPGNVAICATKRTGRSGRSFRGRTYLSGRTINQQNNTNDFQTTFLSSLLTALTTLITSPSAINFTLGVLSFLINGVPQNPGILTPVTSWTADTANDSMRRRLIGRGS